MRVWRAVRAFESMSCHAKPCTQPCAFELIEYIFLFASQQTRVHVRAARLKRRRSAPLTKRRCVSDVTQGSGRTATARHV